MKLFGKKNDTAATTDTDAEMGTDALDTAGAEAGDAGDGFDESHDEFENAAENGGDRQLTAPSRKIAGAGGSRKTLMLGGGLVAVVALLAGGYYFMTSSDSDMPVQVTAATPPVAATPAATPADSGMPPQPTPANAAPAASATGAAPATTTADPFATPAVVPGATAPTAATAADAALGKPPADEKAAIPANEVTTGATAPATGAAPVTPAPDENAPDMPAATLSSPQVPLATAKSASDLPMPAANSMEAATVKSADGAKAAAATAAATTGVAVKTPAAEAAPAWAAPGAATVPGTGAAAAAPKTSSPSEAELAIVQNSAVLDQLTQPVKPAANAAAPASNMPFDPNAPKPATADSLKSVEQILEQQAIIRPVPNGYVTVRKDADSTDIDSRLVAARTALGENRNAAALQMFDGLHTDYPKDKRITMGRAMALQKTGQTDAALAAYEDVLNHDPKNLQALTNMLGLLKSKDPQLALEKLAQLHNAYPYQPDIAAQLGIAYGTTGDYADATKYLDLADALKPGSAYVLYNRAVLNDKMGNVQQAAALYRQILEMAAEGTLDQQLPLDTIRNRLGTMR